LIEKPLVSILITTYNRSNLLKRAINSVLNQSYPNYEIIIVDDCSIDETDKTIGENYKGYCNIKYFKNSENKGNAFSRNVAFQNSRGKYLSFLDDDDYWVDDNKLCMQVEKLESAPVNTGICCTQALLKDNQGNVVATPENFPSNMRFQILQGNEVIHNSTVMIRREIVQEVGGFDVRLKRGIDSEFFRNVITRHHYKVLFLKVPTMYYDTDGSDRITTKTGLREAKKLLFVHSYILWKYWRQYLTEPKALYIRAKNLILQPLRILFK
jgi:glycosyltransferase involved in cell wall biosynthesis